jgi:esterase/lipase superfamily enzyme
MHREYHRWESPILGRPMELLWFGHAGRPQVWFPTSQGRFYQAEDFGLVGAVAGPIERGETQVCCVDSVDAESYYAKDKHPSERIARHDQYDRYILDEVAPFVQDRSVGAPITTLGCSFGAYHAVNFGFRHPDVVDKVVGLSGKYDITSFLDGYWDNTVYYHCPTQYVANMGPDWLGRLSRLDIVVATGQDDNIIEGTRELLRVLRAKRLRHRGDIWDSPYGHDWPWWQAMVRAYVP